MAAAGCRTRDSISRKVCHYRVAGIQIGAIDLLAVRAGYNRCRNKLQDRRDCVVF